jgi:hypothetical protein
LGVAGQTGEAVLTKEDDRSREPNQYRDVVQSWMAADDTLQFDEHGFFIQFVANDVQAAEVKVAELNKHLVLNDIHIAGIEEVNQSLEDAFFKSATTGQDRLAGTGKR